MRRNQRRLAGLLTIMLAVLGISAGVHASRAHAAELDGRYRLVVLAFGEDDFLLLKASGGGDVALEVVDTQDRILPGAKIADVGWQDGRLTFTIESAAGETPFVGRLAADGDEAGMVLGTVTFRDSVYPARLEPTEDEDVHELTRSELPGKVAQASRTGEPEENIAALEALLAETPGPQAHWIHTYLLQEAGAAELTAEAVGQHLETWFAAAERYGDEWLAQCQVKALSALSGKEQYADVALEVAQAADAGLGDDASLSTQADVVTALEAAARAAGQSDVADAAAARLDALQTALDEEYLAKVPPFEPDAFDGRESADADRVVLLELFTGAQCPPCVAADVGFDALIETYESTELVVLQYHLHIPGPDPLTTPEAEARQAYYGVGGTPSTFFNGEELAGGGGGMANARGKYQQYRGIIDQRLADQAAAEIELNVVRSGDKIVINATAQAEVETAAAGPAEPPADEDDADDEAEGTEPQLRLRFALVEESVRYVGGNNLRFHHHVVRAMPGGVEGSELVAGEVSSEAEIDLDELRADHEKYLEEAAARRAFPKALPPMELEHLEVVAFVQDDATKEVLHAVSMAVPAE